VGKLFEGTGDADGIVFVGTGVAEGRSVGKARVGGFFDIPMPPCMPLSLFVFIFVNMKIDGGDGAGTDKVVGEVGIVVGPDGSTVLSLPIFFFFCVGETLDTDITGDCTAMMGLATGTVLDGSTTSAETLKLGSFSAIFFLILLASVVVVLGVSFSLKFGSFAFMAFSIWFLAADIGLALSS
jgi:hypothetical protein